MLDHPILLAEEVSWRTPAGDTVLDRVSLALHREKTGLVGANGSGKTTLLRVLTGEIAPASGRVRRAGSVAVLPQDFRPVEEQTVAEALGVLAEDRPRVLVVTMADADGVAGELRAVGTDVLTLRMDGVGRPTAYVPIPSIAEVRSA